MAARHAARRFSSMDAIVERFMVAPRGRGVCLSQPLLWGDMDAYAHLNNCTHTSVL